MAYIKFPREDLVEHLHFKRQGKNVNSYKKDFSFLKFRILQHLQAF